MTQPISGKSPAVWLTGLGVTFLGYVAIAWPSLAWLHQISDPAHRSASAAAVLPWLAPGVGIVCLRRYGLAAWPGVFLGSVFIWAVVQAANLPLTIAESASDTLGVLLIVQLLQLWGFHATFDRFKDPLILLAAVAVGQAVASLIDVCWIIGDAWITTDQDQVLYLHAIGATRDGPRVVIDTALFDFAFRWWLNMVAGCVLLVPLFSPPATPSRTAQTAGARELAGLLAFLLAWIVLAYRGPPAVAQPLLVIGGILLISWAALRFSVRAASLLTLILSAYAIFGLGLRVGVFSAVSPADRIAVTWGFIALLSGTALFLTSLLAQRNRLRNETARSADLYERLFSGNPFPMWVEDAESGRISIVNAAALRFYGYPESYFIGLDAARLQKPGGHHAPARFRSDGSAVMIEEHLDAAGRRLDVEVTRVAAQLGGRNTRVCFVEPQAERNALRVAILEAGDLERFRLGAGLKTELMPILERITRNAQLLGESSTAGRSVIDLIRIDASQAIAACRRLTRGASPILDAGGDFLEALRRLPRALPESGVAVEVIVNAENAIKLGPDRCDHIYRLAEEAIRRAAAQPGVRRVWITVEVDASRLRLNCVDDAVGSTGNEPASSDDLAVRSIAARASAAHGRIERGRTAAGGTIVSFECAQTPGVALDASTGGTSVVSTRLATFESGADTSAPRSAQPGGYRQWVVSVAGFTVLIFSICSIGAWFLGTAPYFQLTTAPPVPTPWLASGVAIAGLLIGGSSLWPAIVIGTAASWLAFGHSSGFSVVADAFAEALSSLLVVRLLARLGFRHSCDTVRDFALLVVIGAIGQAIVAAAYILSLQIGDAGSAHVLAAHTHPGIAVEHRADTPFAHGFRWWLSGVAGVILVVPASVAWSREALSRVFQNAPARLAWLFCFTALNYAIFSVATPGWNLLIVATALVVIAWASFDLGVAWASSATLVVAVAATASFGFGYGALHEAGAVESGVALWGFIGLLALTAQSCNMLLAEGERADDALRNLEAQYRALFEAIPHPLFAYSALSSRITLANQEALRRYGYPPERLFSMSIDELEDDPGPVPPAGVRARSGAACHRYADGEIVDVELTSIPVEIDGEPSMLLHAVDVGEQIRLRSQMLEATDRERRRLAQDFHDGLGQALTGLSLGIGPLARSVQQGRAPGESNLGFVLMAANEATRICEELLGGISPLQDVDGDLIEALRRLPLRIPPGDRHRLRVSIPEAGAMEMPLVQREHLYQIAQEAVNNALKYSRASYIDVTLRLQMNEVQLTVADNGAGFDSGTVHAGLGLDSFRLRAAALGARLAIESRPGRGTLIRCVCSNVESVILDMVG